MNQVYLGFEIKKEKKVLSDGSVAVNVLITGDVDIRLACITEQHADNLISVIEHSVVWIRHIQDE